MIANPASSTEASVWLRPFQTIIGIKWLVTVVNAAERAVIATMKVQNIGERSAWRAVTSVMLLGMGWLGVDASRVSLASSGMPSGAMPMLSGERRTNRVKGSPTTRNKHPEMNAVQRQPNTRTATANAGVMMAPPTGTAALTTVIARARKRLNQLFATMVGAWTNQAVKEVEITPK